MGYIYNAGCRCGYKVERLFVGCGEAEQADWQPALCAVGQHITMVNRLGGPGRCADSRHTAPPVVYGQARAEPWRSELDGAWRCPRCAMSHLRFERAGLWD